MDTTQTQANQDNWQLTAAEIAEIERINAEEMNRAYGATFKIRVQQVSLIEIEVEGRTMEEAEERALKTLENMPEAGNVLRSNFGHRTIERV